MTPPPVFDPFHYYLLQSLSLSIPLPLNPSHLDSLKDVHHDRKELLVLNHVVLVLVRLCQDLPNLSVTQLKVGTPEDV